MNKYPNIFGRPKIYEGISVICVSVRLFARFTIVESQINLIQTDFSGKRDERKMVSEFAILAQKWSQNGIKKVDFWACSRWI